MVLLEQVQQQYEALPYPHRDPAQELEKLRQPTLVELPMVLEVLWGGRRRVGPGFRVLDAGCGTGDNTVFLAEQLRGTGAEVVALDFSSASLAIARERVSLRGLSEGVRFVHASLETAPELGLGEFDFIVTTGVLHHLESPEIGLAALRDVLKPDGGIGVMVYARYGREPVYEMQSLMRYLAPRTLPEAERLRVLRTTLNALPTTHRAIRGLVDTPMFKREIELNDAGAYDLLLHTQDRAYTVPEIYDWMHGADMTLRAFSVPRRYEPATYLPDDRAASLPEADRHAVAELMHGAMAKHEFYAMRSVAPAPPVIAIDEPSAVPTWAVWRFGELLATALEQNPGRQLNFRFAEERATPVSGDPVTRALLGGVDGQRDLRAIFEIAQRIPERPTPRVIRDRWLDLASPLRGLGVLALHLPA